MEKFIKGRSIHTTLYSMLLSWKLSKFGFTDERIVLSTFSTEINQDNLAANVVVSRK